MSEMKFNIVVSCTGQLQLTFDTVLSVVRQLYSVWCLFILVPEKQKKLAGLVEFLSREDKRINKVLITDGKCLERSLVSRNCSESEEWLFLLEEGDVLTTDALVELSSLIATNTRLKLVYADDAGRVVSSTAPGEVVQRFKPGWSPEYLLVCNYIGRPCLRLDFFNSLGWNFYPYEDWHLWDLLLRASENTNDVGRRERVLLQLAEPQGIPIEVMVKESMEVLTDALSRRGVMGNVTWPDWAKARGVPIFRLVFPDEGPRVAIAIPSRNNHEVLRRCIKSLEATTYINQSVVIIDNESDNTNTVRYLLSLSHRVFRIGSPKGQFNFSYLINRACERLTEEYVLFLNDDTEVINPRWLSQMVGWLQFPEVVSVGARLLFKNDRVQHAGIVNGLLDGLLPAPAFKTLARDDPGYFYQALTSRNVSAVTAACMLTRREEFLDFGGFDESAFGVAYNDCDYGFRTTQKGFRHVYSADTELYHIEGASRGTGRGNDKPSEEAPFVEKYGEWKDVYYNRNLSSKTTMFQVGSRCVIDHRPPSYNCLFVTHSLNREGAPLVLLDIAKGMVQKGPGRPFLLSLIDGPLRHEFEKDGIPVIVRPGLNVFGRRDRRKLQNGLQVAADIYKDFAIDVVVANTILSYWGVAAASEIGCPSIWIIHESEPPFQHLAPHGHCHVELARKCLSAAYQVVFVSNATKAVFEPLETHDNFCVIYNGLDFNHYEQTDRSAKHSEVRKSLGLYGDQLVALLPGIICKRKGQLDLIRALRLMKEKTIEGMSFLIVGDRPSDYSRMVHRALRKLPDRIRSRVYVVPETKEIEKYYVAADVFIVTSYYESFPRVIQEAMFFGLPIITTPVFGIKEQVFDGKSALYFRPGDVKSLARCVERIFAEKDLRSKLGKEAKDTLKKFPTLRGYQARYLELIDEAWVTGQLGR